MPHAYQEYASQTPPVTAETETDSVLTHAEDDAEPLRTQQEASQGRDRVSSSEIPDWLRDLVLSERDLPPHSDVLPDTDQAYQHALATFRKAVQEKLPEWQEYHLLGYNRKGGRQQDVSGLAQLEQLVRQLSQQTLPDAVQPIGQHIETAIGALCQLQRAAADTPQEQGAQITRRVNKLALSLTEAVKALNSLRRYPDTSWQQQVAVLTRQRRSEIAELMLALLSPATPEEGEAIRQQAEQALEVAEQPENAEQQLFHFIREATLDEARATWLAQAELLASTIRMLRDAERKVRNYRHDDLRHVAAESHTLAFGAAFPLPDKTLVLTDAFDRTAEALSQMADRFERQETRFRLASSGEPTHTRALPDRARQWVKKNTEKTGNTLRQASKLPEEGINALKGFAVRADTFMRRELHNSRQLREVKPQIEPETGAAVKIAPVIVLDEIQQFLAVAARFRPLAEKLDAATQRTAQLSAYLAQAGQIPPLSAEEPEQPFRPALRAVLETALADLQSGARENQTALQDKLRATLQPAIRLKNLAAKEAFRAQIVAEVQAALPEHARDVRDRLLPALRHEVEALAQAHSMLSRAMDMMLEHPGALKQARAKAEQATLQATRARHRLKAAVVSLTGTTVHNYTRDSMLARAMGEWASARQAEWQQSRPAIPAEVAERAIKTVLEEIVRHQFVKASDPQAALLRKRVELALQHATEGTLLWPLSPAEVVAEMRGLEAHLLSKAEKKLTYGALNLALKGGWLALDLSLYPLAVTLRLIKHPVRSLIRAAQGSRDIMKGVRPGQERPLAQLDQLLRLETRKALSGAASAFLPSLANYGVSATLAAYGLYRGGEYRTEFLARAMKRLPEDLIWTGSGAGQRRAASAAEPETTQGLPGVPVQPAAETARPLPALPAEDALPEQEQALKVTDTPPLTEPEARPLSRRKRQVTEAVSPEQDIQRIRQINPDIYAESVAGELPGRDLLQQRRETEKEIGQINSDKALVISAMKAEVENLKRQGIPALFWLNEIKIRDEKNNTLSTTALSLNDEMRHLNKKIGQLNKKQDDIRKGIVQAAAVRRVYKEGLSIVENLPDDNQKALSELKEKRETALQHNARRSAAERESAALAWDIAEYHFYSTRFPGESHEQKIARIILNREAATTDFIRQVAMAPEESERADQEADQAENRLLIERKVAAITSDPACPQEITRQLEKTLTDYRDATNEQLMSALNLTLHTLLIKNYNNEAFVEALFCLQAKTVLGLDNPVALTEGTTEQQESRLNKLLNVDAENRALKSFIAFFRRESLNQSAYSVAASRIYTGSVNPDLEIRKKMLQETIGKQEKRIKTLEEKIKQADAQKIVSRTKRGFGGPGYTTIRTKPKSNVNENSGKSVGKTRQDKEYERYTSELTILKESKAALTKEIKAIEDELVALTSSLPETYLAGIRYIDDLFNNLQSSYHNDELAFEEANYAIAFEMNILMEQFETVDEDERKAISQRIEALQIAKYHLEVKKVNLTEHKKLVAHLPQKADKPRGTMMDIINARNHAARTLRSGTESSASQGEETLFNNIISQGGEEAQKVSYLSALLFYQMHHPNENLLKVQPYQVIAYFKEMNARYSAELTSFPDLPPDNYLGFENILPSSEFEKTADFYQQFIDYENNGSLKYDARLNTSALLESLELSTSALASPPEEIWRFKLSRGHLYPQGFKGYSQPIPDVKANEGAGYLYRLKGNDFLFVMHIEGQIKTAFLTAEEMHDQELISRKGIKIPGTKAGAGYIEDDKVYQKVYGNRQPANEGQAWRNKKEAYIGSGVSAEKVSAQSYKSLKESVSDAYDLSLRGLLKYAKEEYREKSWPQRVAEFVIPYYGEAYRAINDPAYQVDKESLIMDTITLATAFVSAGVSINKVSRSALKELAQFVSNSRSRGLTGSALRVATVKKMGELGIKAATTSGKIALETAIDVIEPFPVKSAVSGIRQLPGNVSNTVKKLKGLGGNKGFPAAWSRKDINLDYLTPENGIYKIRPATATTMMDFDYFIKQDDAVYQLRWDENRNSWLLVNPASAGPLGYALPVKQDSEGLWKINTETGLRGGGRDVEGVNLQQDIKAGKNIRLEKMKGMPVSEGYEPYASMPGLYYKYIGDDVHYSFRSGTNYYPVKKITGKRVIEVELNNGSLEKLIYNPQERVIDVMKDYQKSEISYNQQLDLYMATEPGKKEIHYFKIDSEKNKIVETKIEAVGPEELSGKPGINHVEFKEFTIFLPDKAAKSPTFQNQVKVYLVSHGAYEKGIFGTRLGSSGETTVPQNMAVNYYVKHGDPLITMDRPEEALQKITTNKVPVQETIGGGNKVNNYYLDPFENFDRKQVIHQTNDKVTVYLKKKSNLATLLEDLKLVFGDKKIELYHFSCRSRI